MRIHNTQLRAHARRAWKDSGFLQTYIADQLGISQGHLAKALQLHNPQPYTRVLCQVIAMCERREHYGEFQHFGEPYPQLIHAPLTTGT